MQFSLAANYDVDLASPLGAYPVDEVYGKLPADSVGGGRPSYMGTPLGWRKLAEYVAALSGQGIAFNYLLNSSCYGNREWGRSWQRQLMRLMARLKKAGILRVTVATPYLLELVKARFPEFRVRVGIFAQVDTPTRARFWEDLGADAITLESFSINRDLERLAAIRAAVDCDLQLIANHACLPNCPMQPYHQNGFAHSSAGDGGLFIDYCLLRCARKRLQDPSLFIKAGWIRPEDLSAYEALGFHSFKLLERGIPSAELIRRLDAYTTGKSGPNLANLVLSYGFREPLKRSRFWGVQHFFKPRDVAPNRLVPLLDLARQQGMLFPRENTPVRIDSARIPSEFLGQVEHCQGGTEGCGSCRYCDEIAREAVTIDPQFRDESLERFASVEASLADGGLWDV